MTDSKLIENFDIEAAVEEAIKTVPDDLAKKEELEKMKEAVIRSYKKGTFVLSELGFSQEMVDLMYQSASELYEAQKFDEALSIYSALASVDPLNFRASFGLALCNHKTERFGDAILYYLVCRQQRPEDPLPFYYMADCYFKLKSAEAGLECLRQAYYLSLEDEKYKDIGERSMLWYIKMAGKRIAHLENKKKQKKKEK